MSCAGLEHIFEHFSIMIQSGKDIFLDNKTILTVYSFTPIEAGTKPMQLSTSKCELFGEVLVLWRSRILKIKLALLDVWC